MEVRFFITIVLESGLMLFLKDKEGSKVSFSNYNDAEESILLLAASPQKTSGMYQVQKFFIVN